MMENTSYTSLFKFIRLKIQFMMTKTLCIVYWEFSFFKISYSYLFEKVAKESVVTRLNLNQTSQTHQDWRLLIIFRQLASFIITQSITWRKKSLSSRRNFWFLSAKVFYAPNNALEKFQSIFLSPIPILKLKTKKLNFEGKKKRHSSLLVNFL